MLKFLLFILMALLFEPGGLQCQPYYFRHFQVENGLSNNTVFCTAEDNRGFLWLGTKDGLNRFDGYSFKTFRNDPADAQSIGDNSIRSLYADKAGVLYVGTHHGLYKYNAFTENFATIYVTNDEIRDIKKDSTGLLWFIAGVSLFTCNENTGVLHTYTGFDATSICTDGKGIVWVATANGFIQRYNRQQENFTSFNLFDSTQKVTSRWIEKIYATASGSILAGTSNYGVKLFDLTNFTYKDLLTYNPNKTEIFARDFIRQSGDEYWIATESGVFIYNIQTGSFINLRKDNNSPYAISDNAVYSLCKDREGGIWAGTFFGGINYYRRQYTSFKKYFPTDKANSLSGNAVREICQDKYCNLWIGTEDAGLNKLDKTKGLFTHYEPTGAKTDITYSNIHGLLARGNELWIGTFEHGLDVMDIKNGKVTRHYPSAIYPSLLKSNFIVTIYQSTQGIIYIGTRLGLYYLDSASGNFNNQKEIPGNCFVHALQQDGRGNLWVATLGNGLFYYNIFTGKTGNFTYRASEKNCLGSNTVTGLFIDSRQNLWCATEGGGLCKFNYNDSTFTKYDVKDGLPGNTVFKVLEDGRHQLWFTTSKGLVCFAPETKNIKVFTTANGLLSDQFNYNSGYRDSDGTMYFGSAKGLISFNPETFTQSTFLPPVYITGFLVNNKELPINVKGSPLQQAISFTKNITLTYDQASFNIEFAALSFTAPEMTLYKYKMEGLEKDWTTLTTNRKVYFTGLAPGYYTFKVKAANSSGIWNDKETVLHIKISPPFWASWWAYCFYMCGTILIIYLLVKSYHQRVQEKIKQDVKLFELEKEKEISQAKIEFFTNVAHEIKTPLTLIKGPLEKVIKKAGANDEISHNLKIMERNTDRLIELTNQLLDFRKTEISGFHLNFVKTNITALLEERSVSFKLLAEEKGISFNTSLPPEPLHAYVDMDALHKVVNNLFNNALLYSNSKMEVVLYSVAKHDLLFKIKFSNDGFLVPVEMKEKIFEPFYRMQETAGKRGSGIGLALSRALVELHKGTLELLQTQNGMNVFLLTMPIHQKIEFNLS